MTPKLKDKKLYNSRLARELVESEGYKQLQQRAGEKKEQVLKEALDSKSIDDLRYNKGFLDGLEFLDSIVGQWIRQSKV